MKYALFGGSTKPDGWLRGGIPPKGDENLIARHGLVLKRRQKNE